MKVLQGKSVLITGAGGGIGLEAAKIFAEKGCSLILLDVNVKGLEKSRQILTSYGSKVQDFVVDITNEKEIAKLAAELGKAPDIIVNIAGVGFHGELAHTDLKTWKMLMDVNFWGPLYLIYAFLPEMMEKKSGAIVNVSSGQAFYRLPTWGAYSIAKLAIGAASELMHFELKKYGIHVSTVYPYMVNTGFYNDVSKGKTLMSKLSMVLLPLYSITPQTVGRQIVEAVEKERAVENTHIATSLGEWMRGIPFLSRIFTSTMDYFMAGREEDTMLNNALKTLESGLNSITDTEYGFKIDETMTGEHEFEPKFGKPGKKFMEFKATWGPDKILSWSDKEDGQIYKSKLTGTVTIEDLCEHTPMEGTLELRYLKDNKIIYDFVFQANGKNYHYTGEKRDIHAWNLPVSHTTCYGRLVDTESGELVSTSVTYFKMNTMIDFLSSLRFEPAAV